MVFKDFTGYWCTMSLWRIELPLSFNFADFCIVHAWVV